MKRLPLVSGLVLLALLAAPGQLWGQLDSSLQQQIDGQFLESGGNRYDIGHWLPYFDRMREKIFGSIHAKLHQDPRDYDLSSDLDLLDRFRRKCEVWADVIATQRPDLKQAIAWFRANATLAGAWESVLHDGTAIPDLKGGALNRLQQLESGNGQPFAGMLGTRIEWLRNLSQDGIRSAFWDDAARQVRAASGFALAGQGLARLDFSLSRYVVRPGESIPVIVVCGVGIDTDPSKSEVRFALNITGVGGKSTSSGGPYRFEPGVTRADDSLIVLNTTGLPAGDYEARLLAIDSAGNSMTRGPELFRLDPSAPAGGATGPTGPGVGGGVTFSDKKPGGLELILDFSGPTPVVIGGRALPGGSPFVIRPTTPPSAKFDVVISIPSSPALVGHGQLKGTVSPLGPITVTFPQLALTTKSIGFGPKTVDVTLER